MHLNVKADGAVGYASPQSSYSEQGEAARVSWEQRDAFAMFGNVNLPYKIVLSTEFDAKSSRPYNSTTGADNNGDGNFNDRAA